MTANSTWFTQYQKQYELKAICTYQRTGHMFDTIAPVDTFTSTTQQIRIYKRRNS